jgi:energy-coupling factor transporter ATP-binding protein EcfA2
MGLLHDILRWSQALPTWQRDAIRRLLLNENGLSEADQLELYALMKRENGIEVDTDLAAYPLEAEHLPAETVEGDNMIILGLRGLRNVNRISSDHALKFAESGMTVIYGGNGSGKSGYARVMKRACRARDQSDPIHPNAHDPSTTAKIPTAKFDIKVAGGSEEVIWLHDSTSPDRLSKISVFDSRCARSYVTDEKDVAYLPYGLDIVENLAGQVLPKLTELLDAEIAAINVDKLPFEHLLGDTEVGRLIDSLSFDSDPLAIASLGALSEAEANRVNDLDKTLKEADPLSKAKELKLSATRLKTYGEKLAKPLAWVSPEAVEKLQKLASEKTAAEVAETKAADALRSGEELLPGTGGQVWKLLFEAARRYSTEVAYPDEVFPPSDDGKICPLCQEDLEATGLNRIKRFETFIENDVAKTAVEARRKIDIEKSKIESADLLVEPDEALRDEMNELDASITSAMEAYQASLDHRRTAILKCLETSNWLSIPSLDICPRARVRQLAARQLKECRTLLRAADERKRYELEAEREELAARQNLVKCLNSVLGLIQRMKNKAALEKCRPSLRTRPISDKSKEFASIAVTAQLKTSLDREFTALGVGHIQTVLKDRAIRGKTLHQLVLDLPAACKIEEILSEGEQRAIALGSFLAELALGNHSCGIVLDDPVSSLDHKRRGKVAHRLAQEALNRQVIVFTHEVVFLQQLQDESRDGEIAIYSLETSGGFAGKVSEGLPWIHKSFKERLSNLDANCRRFERLPWPDDPSEELSSDMTRQYSFIRATIERITQDLILNGTVQRFRDYIEVSRLRRVVGLEDGEVSELLRLNQRCHDVVEAHDPSSARDLPPPNASELRQDIDDLKALIQRVNDRRDTPKPTTTVA